MDDVTKSTIIQNNDKYAFQRGTYSNGDLVIRYPPRMGTFFCFAYSGRDLVHCSHPRFRALLFEKNVFPGENGSNRLRGYSVPDR